MAVEYDIHAANTYKRNHPTKYLTKINHQKQYNNNMRYTTEINEETIKELERIVKEEERYKSRYYNVP